MVDEMDQDYAKDEGPQDIDLERLGGEDESETIPCPACGEEIYEDAQRCPFCGQYVVTRLHRPAGWGKWLLVGLAILLLSVYLATC